MAGPRSTRWARVARGAMLAAASLFVASMSHVAAGGHAPGPLALTLAGAFALVACTAVAGGSLSLLRLVAGVAVSQLLLHLLFSLDGGSGGSAAVAGHHGELIALSPSASGMALETDPAMWIAHAIAGVLTVTLIRRGHLAVRALRALARPFRALLRRTQPVLPAPRAAVSGPRAPRRLPPPRSRAWAGPLSRRGPPLLSY